jgi:hypothetical protein
MDTFGDKRVLYLKAMAFLPPAYELIATRDADFCTDCKRRFYASSAWAGRRSREEHARGPLLRSQIPPSCKSEP